jgi:hypothetical protein
MVFILFSAFGPDFSASDFVSKHGIKTASVWSKGQPLRSGNLHEDAGFSLNFDEVQATSGVVPSIGAFLNENQSWLAVLHEQPVERLLHIGVTVGEERSFAPCLEFDLTFLKLLVDERIDLYISAYPTSDESDE